MYYVRRAMTVSYGVLLRKLMLAKKNFFTPLFFSNPGEVHELHEATITTPGIFVVTPDDMEHDLTPSVLKNQPHIDQQSASPRISSASGALVHTARPPMPMDS